MASVRVLVGTKKGAFTLTADGARRDWRVGGPFFGGWAVMHVNGSPADPDRLWASQWTDWHGQVVQRSDDGGATWAPVGNGFAYEGDPGTHLWYDGTPHPWEFNRVWHIEPSPDDPDVVFAGVEDAGLFRSGDGGGTWTELPALRTHGRGPDWHPGAGGMCLHTVIIDPADTRRMFVAISAAGAFRTEDGGETWSIATGGLRSEFLPDPEAPLGHCVHNLAMHPDRPDTLFMQKHWDVCRSDDAGDTWTEVSGDLPSDFGFPVAVHAHEPETVYVVPILSDAEHYPPEGRLRVRPQPHRRRRVGAARAGAPPARLLRQRPARRDGGGRPRRLRRLRRHHRGPGLRVRRRRRHVDRDRRAPPGGALGGGPDAPVTPVRVSLPHHLRTPRRRRGGGGGRGGR